MPHTIIKCKSVLGRSAQKERLLWVAVINHNLYGKHKQQNQEDISTFFHFSGSLLTLLRRLRKTHLVLKCWICAGCLQELGLLASNISTCFHLMAIVSLFTTHILITTSLRFCRIIMFSTFYILHPCQGTPNHLGKK